MPAYSAIAVSKYGKRVLLERIVRLALAVKLYKTAWLLQYISSTRSLYGELPLCTEACNLLDELWRSKQGLPAPLQWQS